MSCLYYKHLMFRVTDQEVERLIPLRTGAAVTQLKKDDDKMVIKIIN